MKNCSECPYYKIQLGFFTYMIAFRRLRWFRIGIPSFAYFRHLGYHFFTVHRSRKITTCTFKKSYLCSGCVYYSSKSILVTTEVMVWRHLCVTLRDPRIWTFGNLQYSWLRQLRFVHNGYSKAETTKLKKKNKKQLKLKSHK